MSNPNTAQFISEWIEKQFSRMLPARKDQVASDDDLSLRDRWRMRHVRRIDGDLADDLERYQTGRWAVEIRPPEQSDEDPDKPSLRVLRAIFGDFPVSSWEITEVNNRIVYRVVLHSERDANHLTNKVLNLTDCGAEIVDKPELPGQKGDWAAISTIGIKEDHLFPVKHAESEDETQPYRQLLDTLSSEWEGQTTIQFVMEPASDWTTRWARGIPFDPGTRRRLVSGDFVREDRRPSMMVAALATVVAGVGIWTATISPMIQTILIAAAMIVCGSLWICAVIGDGFIPMRITAKRTAEWQREQPWHEIGATKTERKDIDPIARQGESPSWRVYGRIMTVAEDRKTAHSYHERVSKAMRTAWQNRATGQRFVANPVRRERYFRKLARQIVKREPHRQRLRTWSSKLLLKGQRRWPIYWSDFEAASVLQWPDRSMGGAANIEYATVRAEDPDAQADEFAADARDDVPAIGNGPRHDRDDQLDDVDEQDEREIDDVWDDAQVVE